MPLGREKMSQIPTFIIKDDWVVSDKPENWSYSALNSFQSCPKRWALSQAYFPCFKGRIPPKPNRNTVEGILLHELIDAYVSKGGVRDGVGFKPRRELLNLIEKWRLENATNPRIDSRMIAAQLRVEEMLSEFADSAPKGLIVKQAAFPKTKQHSSHSFSSTDGSEKWLRDRKSKLIGRADFIFAGEIWDFKTGEEKEEHIRQLKFYGGLYYAMTGVAPKRLRLVYARLRKFVDVECPQICELERDLDELRGIATNADAAIASGVLKAVPSSENCTYCAVRGFCEEYWANLARISRLSVCEGGRLIDYSPTDAATAEPAASGVYIRDMICGVSSVLFIPGGTERLAETLISDIRLTAIKTQLEGNLLRLVLTPSSEFFVGAKR